MDRVEMKRCGQLVRSLGRTFFHEKTGVLYCNWTCSGLELMFSGTVLMAEVTACPSVEIEGLPWDQNAPTHLNYPCLGVLVDDEEEPSRYIEVGSKEESCLIFRSNEPQVHRIRIVKLTENIKAKLGIRALVMEGALQPLPPPEGKKRIEFVGDSITCGFGNMTKERDRLFYTADENGWFSHAAIAARELDMELSMVCVSGICIAKECGLPNEYGMDMLYGCTDRIIQELLDREEEPERWDFAAHPSDYVVVNLGTNDATGLVFSEDPEGRVREFRRNYRSFLEAVRARNGEKTRILCALGSLDYYLFSDIVEVVGEYRRDTGDERVSVFRYQKINPMDGWGACGHPGLATQKKMAAEIAREIRRLERIQSEECAVKAGSMESEG